MSGKKRHSSGVPFTVVTKIIRLQSEKNETSYSRGLLRWALLLTGRGLSSVSVKSCGTPPVRSEVNAIVPSEHHVG